MSKKAIYVRFGKEAFLDTPNVSGIPRIGHILALCIHHFPNPNVGNFPIHNIGPIQCPLFLHKYYPKNDITQWVTDRFWIMSTIGRKS